MSSQAEPAVFTLPAAAALICASERIIFSTPLAGRATLATTLRSILGGVWFVARSSAKTSVMTPSRAPIIETSVANVVESGGSSKIGGSFGACPCGVFIAYPQLSVVMVKAARRWRVVQPVAPNEEAA